MSVSDKIVTYEGVNRIIRNPYLALVATKHFHVIGENGNNEYTVVMYERESTAKIRLDEDFVIYIMKVKDEGVGITYILEEAKKGGNQYKISFMKSGNNLTVLITGKKGGGLLNKSPFIEPEHLITHIKEILGNV
ncbi:hypothetical protein [Sulfuracidifex metallicus]|uniref:hypothetical protein n=1 Tax=Sulfuracidifex metallicus TaxID=47303 RepID=UPI0022751E00|nr:hypothetical protein [Sulfuracidifex metallicus]MCY0850121.1 hypothetical protein [Sulfuracidifex metallicus]